MIRRQQGSGSFVASAPHRLDEVAHCRFLANDGNSVLPVFSRVVTRKAAPRKGPWSAFFASDANVLAFDRVLNVNDEFDVYSRFCFDAAASRPWPRGR